MEPITLKTGEQLDPSVVRFMRAIRQKESGGNFNAVGDAGTSTGAYQFQPDTWKRYAKEVLGDENAEQSKGNQNKVAYTKIKGWKDSGWQPEQVAAAWNAGEGKVADGSWMNNVGTTTINGQQIAYNTPQYVKDVLEIAKQMKTQEVGNQIQQPISEQQVPQEVSQTQQVPTENKGTLLDRTQNIVSKIFPGEKIGESIGTLAGYALTKGKDILQGTNIAENYDTSAPTPLQTIGDTAQAALTVGAGMPGKAVSAFGKAIPLARTASSVTGRIAQGAALGAGIGGTGAIAQGETNVGEIGKQAAIGGATGGVLSTAGEIINKAAQTLPERFVRSFVPGINEETAKYAVNKGLGSPQKMLQESKQSIDDLGNQIKNILKSDRYRSIVLEGKPTLQQVADQFPDSGLTPELIVSNIKKILPLKMNLIDKMYKGSLTLQEANDLRKALGNNVFKTVFDDPAVKANKEIGSAVYHTLSDFIKTQAKETEPLFSTLTKEIPLKKALEQAIRRGQKSKTFTLRDLLAVIAGLGVGGPFGGVAGYVGERVVTSPTVNLNAGRLINNAKNGLGVVKPLIIRGSENIGI